MNGDEFASRVHRMPGTLIYADREALAVAEEISMEELSRRVQEVKPRFTTDFILRVPHPCGVCKGGDFDIRFCPPPSLLISDF